MDAPGTGYWDRWLDFVADGPLEHGMIFPEDLDLLLHTTSLEEAAEEIIGFYANYHSQRFVKGRLILRLRLKPTPPQLEELNDLFGDILVDGVIEAVDPTDEEVEDRDHTELARIQMHFNRRSLGRLRSLIDHLNGYATGLAPSPPD